MMRRLTILLAVALVGLASCANPRKVTFSGPAEYEIETASKINVSCDVLNCTAYKLTLKSGRFKLYYGSSDYATVLVGGEVSIPRCGQARVAVPLRVRFADPLMMLSAATMETIPFDRLTISGEAVVRAGAARKKIRFERYPLSQIVSIFESGSKL